MVNVLVTGGAGYIGSHVCKALCKAGMTPVALDNLSMGHRWAVKWGPLEVSDLGDRARLDEILAKYRPKSVIHLAGSAYVGESMTNPWKYYRNNVVASLTLFEAMRHGGVTEIVFSSTCSTYGLPASVPITEASPQKPINPYGKSKLMIEQMLADFQQSDGMRHLSLRYFNAAGADPDGEIGELHEPETHLIPILLQVASGQRDQVEIFGQDYATTDGTAIRDYVHVSDLATAHVQALAYLDNGGTKSALNLGTGSGHSVMEVIEMVRHVTSRPVKFTVSRRRQGDPPELIADHSESSSVLHWKPGLSNLKDIVQTAWQWHMQRASDSGANVAQSGPGDR